MPELVGTPLSKMSKPTSSHISQAPAPLRKPPVVLQDSLQFLPSAETNLTAATLRPAAKKPAGGHAKARKARAAAENFCCLSPAAGARKRGACFVDDGERAAVMRTMKQGRAKLLEAAARKTAKKQAGKKENARDFAPARDSDAASSESDELSEYDGED